MKQDHAHYMRRARDVAQGSPEPLGAKSGTKVASVLVSPDGEVIAEAFNTFPKGVALKEERFADRDLKLKYSLHSEIRAVLQALQAGKTVEGATLYVYPFSPCTPCARIVIEAGVAELVYEDKPPLDRWREDQEFALAMMREAGLKITTIPPISDGGAIPDGGDHLEPARPVRPPESSSGSSAS